MDSVSGLGSEIKGIKDKNTMKSIFLNFFDENVAQDVAQFLVKKWYTSVVGSEKFASQV